MVLDADAQLQVQAASPVSLRVECADLGLNLAMLLVGDPKGRVSFQKLASALSCSGLVGQPFDTSQEAELDRFEAARQHSDALRREREDFYTRIESRFSELAETMQRMKRDYYREVDHLREQLSRKRRKPDFEPESVVFFDPSGYKLPCWQDVIAQLDGMRMKRDLLQNELGGEHIRRVPVNMLCERCRKKFQTPEEELAVYEEEHRHRATQCSFMDSSMVGPSEVSVQTDWVPVVQPLALLLQTSGTTPHESSKATIDQLSLAAQGAAMEDSSHLSVRPPDAAPDGYAECHLQGSGDMHAESDQPLGSSAGGTSMIDDKDGPGELGNVSWLLRGDVFGNNGRGPFDRPFEGVEADATSPSHRGSEVLQPAGDTTTPPSDARTLADAGGQRSSLDSSVAPGSFSTHCKTGPQRRRRSLDAHQEPGSMCQATKVDLEERTKRLSASLEMVFSQEPANQRRRALQILRQNTMTRKQRTAALLARQLEAIRKHVQRQVFTRWKVAVSAASSPKHGIEGDLWEQVSGPPLRASEIGGLVGVQAEPQHMIVAGDARARVPVQRGRPRSRLLRQALAPHGQALDLHDLGEADSAWENQFLSPSRSVVSDLQSGWLSPPSAAMSFPWEKRAHSNTTFDGELSFGSDFRSQTASPVKIATKHMKNGGVIARAAARRRFCGAEGDFDVSRRMVKAYSTGDICLPKLAEGRPSPASPVKLRA